MIFEAARAVADAVLYEGYLLYPYRASARKNQVRWQFGVLVPPSFGAVAAETPFSQTECLVEPGDDARLHVRARFLQLQARTVEVADATAPGGFRGVDSIEVDGAPLLPWDETVEREADAVVGLADVVGTEVAAPIEAAAGCDVEEVADRLGRPVGRVVRRRWPVTGAMRLSGEAVPGPYGLVRLRIRIENSCGDELGDRDESLRRSLIATHALVAVTGGAFVSLLEPPEWARPAAGACVNRHAFPVLVGERARRDLMLSSPIILYDYPEIAPESPAELFDGTEIDEILSLRTMALSDEEKREARATHERAAAIIDHVDSMPQEMLDRLHGAVRYVRASAESHADDPHPDATPPWWDPGSDSSVSPDTDAVVVAGVPVARGSVVRLRPGLRRADAQDIFLDGRLATVEAVLFDVDGNEHLAVTLRDDPAADLHRAHGRFLYFAADEVEPTGAPR